MECQVCGRWAPMDRETGYDADDLCPTCKDVEPDWIELGEDMADEYNNEQNDGVPKGWTRIYEDVRRGGLVYVYPAGVLPNGETEHHLTRDRLHKYVFPNRA